ncbi:glutathione S-transferase [Boletus reticuloceps]|uniref:Glutathione S-transferase n=1 Tax=Boletus reticuloceps TaxID=495285 RepID=A0A8I2YF31_9AGAM|nr:glutathione S-transferase [Boletus reticuloceps]
MASAQFTLYGAPVGFTPQREVSQVELALKEGNIPYKYYSVDFDNKPAFFAEQINPIGKVPAITYGGPDVDPEKPSPLSVKLTESNVILEFVADIYPEAKLMPIDPVQRARVRFFIEAATRTYLPAYMAWILNQEPQATENHLKAIAFLQRLLPNSGEYAVGDCYTIADACITPLILRLQLSIEHDIGKFPVGNGPKFGELLKDPKYAKFMTYASAITARPVAKETWNPKKEIVKEVWNYLLGRESTFELTAEQKGARG